MTTGTGPPAVSWRSVLPATVALAVVLTVLSGRYGYHRDELYFRGLPPRLNYVDQPGFVPLVARLTRHLADEPWALRIPATVCAVGSVLVVVLITRELGGGRAAQTWCAWTYAFAATPLIFGHVLLTSTVDLVVWPLACLFVIRAVLRGRPQWWLAAGLLIGLSTYSKLLIGLLVVALAIGILISGPRRLLVSPWVLGGAVLALVVAAPNLAYQLAHHWPQLTMGRALRANNAGTVRIVMWPYLALLLGPPLVPAWVAGLVQLWRRPEWRPLRFLVPAFAALLVETFLAGGQLYYPVGLLVVLFAIGWVPAAEFLARSRPWRTTAVALFTLNVVVSSVIALPLLPLPALAASPIPGINVTQADQVGWQDYVADVDTAYRRVPSGQRGRTVVIASNYGEWGALKRYGPALGLPTPYAGQNQLWFDARPPNTTTTAVIFGAQIDDVRAQFRSCDTVTHLTNRAGVDNEEQGEPVTVCQGPLRPWSSVWQDFLHYD